LSTRTTKRHDKTARQYLLAIAAGNCIPPSGFLTMIGQKPEPSTVRGMARIPDPKLRRAIDAFAREDLCYGEDVDGEHNSADSIQESIRRLKILTAEGKPVFVVEYPRDDEQAQAAQREIAEQNFVGLMARRALDRSD
jgi:hypothetical protein